MLLRVKKNENLPFSITWVDLEGIMLSEINQTEKSKSTLTCKTKIYNKLLQNPLNDNFRFILLINGQDFF